MSHVSTSECESDRINFKESNIHEIAFVYTNWFQKLVNYRKPHFFPYAWLFIRHFTFSFKNKSFKLGKTNFWY